MVVQAKVQRTSEHQKVHECKCDGSVGIHFAMILMWVSCILCYQ